MDYARSTVANAILAASLTMLPRWPALLLLLLASRALALQAAEPPTAIKLAEAKDHVGKEVQVEVVVQSSRLLESGKYCFLNSEKSFTSKTNFTIAITAEGLAKYREAGIENPATHFKQKTIHVSGKISSYKEQLQIDVADPKQIVVVRQLQAKKK